MNFMGIEYVVAANFTAIPEAFRINWSGLVIDSRTVKAATLKQFAETMGLWGDMKGNLAAGSDAISTVGSKRDDVLTGTNGNDLMVGKAGDDTLSGGDGNDFLIGSKGNDTIDLGDGFFNRAKGGTGNDDITGGSGIDWVHANGGNDTVVLMGGNDKAYGGSGNDMLDGGTGDDWLQGADGMDTVLGGHGDDTMHGGAHADVIEDRDGRDWFDGGDGDDHLISRSDAGIPDMKVDDFDPASIDFSAWSDRMTGGTGADTFEFIYEMNSSQEVAARNLDPDGTVNWMMVMRENSNPHDHWVDWGGHDRIDDFSRADGDTIRITGHTVNVSGLAFIDTDNDGTDDSTLITVYSDQAAQMMMMGMGGMPMAHDRDFLGTILVEGALIDMSDIILSPMSMEAAFDML